MSAAGDPDPLYDATVIWYDRAVGYGFLMLDGYPRDVLVHNTEVRKGDMGRDYLLKGDKLRCRVSLHRGKPSCTDLERVDMQPG